RAVIAGAAGLNYAPGVWMLLTTHAAPCNHLDVRSIAGLIGLVNDAVRQGLGENREDGEGDGYRSHGLGALRVGSLHRERHGSSGLGARRAGDHAVAIAVS